MLRVSRQDGRPGRQSGHGGEVEGSRRFLEPATATAVSPATATAVSPAAATPAAIVTVVAPVVPAAVVATSAEKPIVAGAGANARVGPVSPPTAVAPATTYEVRDDAKDYTYRDHEQDNQKQFHGTILPVDAPGYKVVFYPYASLGYNSAGILCVRARVVY